MEKFQRNNKFSGKRSYNTRFSDKPTLYKATCANCGKECEVPFKPTGSKPVLCRDCFKNTDSNPRRFDRNNSKNSSFSNRQMYDAVCDNCGNSCKIPFQPRSGKPVFCSNCFEKNENATSRKVDNRISEKSEYKEQFELLNAKLDKVVEMLARTVSNAEVSQKHVIPEKENSQVQTMLTPDKKITKKAKKQSENKESTS